MQANIEMDEGKNRLLAIIQSLPSDSPHWSEAQNRFQFVDRLLTECLGWEQPHIKVEPFDEAGGRSDYLLGRPVRAALEAKREAKVFDLLPASRPEAVRKLRPLTEACPILKAACAQVVTYCAFHGAQIAIVCNGPQLVLFQASIPGSSPFDGECFCFDGFSAYIKNFSLLWRLLSPEGVFENRAYRSIAYHRNPRLPMKASSALTDPNAYRYRTNFQENLRNVASVLLDNIDEVPEVKSEFYRECYVPIEANNRHLLLSKNVISARYRRASSDGVAPAAITTTIAGGRVQVTQGLTGTLSGKPVVVIGDVGVGKTSFFENLYEQLDASERTRTLYLHINLGEKATLSQDIKSYILNSIPQTLRDRYNININSSAFCDRLYARDIRDFDDSNDGRLKGISPVDYEKAKIAHIGKLISQADLHLQRAIEHISKDMDLQLMIVLDNADQRRFEIQQDTFLIAQELAATRSALIFVALRPATFFQSKLSGALSGYQNRVLTIAPPPADEVIRKRIAFAVRVAEGRAAPAALRNVELNLASIVSFLTATLRSIKSNPQIQSFLSNITGGNTRLVIELFTSFCGSPNVESERIVRIENEEHNYTVPLHEFTKHALLGEYAYYNPLSSYVACNVFDVTTADPNEHFLCALAVAYLTSSLGVKDSDGFVLGASIISEMMRLGFTEDQTRLGLRRLALRRLIETPHGHYRELSVPADERPDTYYFRATSIGAYHIRYWIGSFSFLDAVSIDTPIFDEAARDVIIGRVNSNVINDRHLKTVTFRDYLLSKWQIANFDVNYYDFPAVVSSQHDGFAAVEKHLDTARRPRYESGVNRDRPRGKPRA